VSTTTAVYALTKPANLGDSGTWGTPVDTNFDTIDDVMARPKIVQNAPTYNVGGTTTLDLSLARVFVFTVSGASTLAFSNVPSSTFAVHVHLVISNGSAFALTFPASVTWLPGVAPLFKTAGVDIVDLVTKDGGTTWYGSARHPATIRGPAGTAAAPAFQAGVSGPGLYGSGISASATQLMGFTVAPNVNTNFAHIVADSSGPYNIYGSGSHATGGTTGFIFLNTCAGTPTGVPATVVGAPSGAVACLYDTTANKLWVYNGAWRGVVLT